MKIESMLQASHIFTEIEIKESAVDDDTYLRGDMYYAKKTVKGIKQIGQTILADVKGEQTYQVAIIFNPEAEDYYATCTCPDQRIGNCKHIIAVLLTLKYNSERVTIVTKLKDTRNDMLASLTKDAPIMARIVREHQDTVINADLLRVAWALYYLTPYDFTNWVERLGKRADALPQRNEV